MSKVDIHRAEAQTRRWVEEVVIGHQLCPFAAPVVKQGQLMIEVSNALHELDALQDLEALIETMRRSDDPAHKTCLLVMPELFSDFDEYNQFLDRAEALLEIMQADQVLQLASFHPGYCFAGTPATAAENYTNRSPWPMLHLLRVDSVARAVDGYADIEQVPLRNIERMEEIGVAALAEQLAGLRL